MILTHLRAHNGRVSKTAAVPFQAVPRGPNAAKALAEIAETDAALRSYDAGRAAMFEARAAAIRRARAEKVSLREIADLLGVSPERVRQMEAGK